MNAVHVLIRGQVQGVGYRAWTVREAQKRRLTGWVRNRADGAVEALFCGEDEAVQAMIAACRAGPRMSQVREIVAEPYAGPNPSGFSALATA